MLYDMMGKE